MELRKGDVYYNQEIPTEEFWEDTLKRDDLKIFQLNDPVGIDVLDKLNVTMYRPENGELAIADSGDLDKKEIKELIRTCIK